MMGYAILGKLGWEHFYTMDTIPNGIIAWGLNRILYRSFQNGNRDQCAIFRKYKKVGMLSCA